MLSAARIFYSKAHHGRGQQRRCSSLLLSSISPWIYQGYTMYEHTAFGRTFIPLSISYTHEAYLHNDLYLCYVRCQLAVYGYAVLTRHSLLRKPVSPLSLSIFPVSLMLLQRLPPTNFRMVGERGYQRYFCHTLKRFTAFNLASQLQYTTCIFFPYF